MLEKLKLWTDRFGEDKKEIKLKIIYLAATFLLMSMCLVIWRPMQNAVFSKTVGVHFIPDAKLYSLLFVIPLVLAYSILVDWLRRHHLLYCFTIIYGIGGLFFYYFLSHPVYGIANTQTSPDRWIGWAFYFFMESFNAFFSTTFWAFADSINNHKDAQNYYGFIVAGSKIGGMLSAGSLYLLLRFLPTNNQTMVLTRAFILGSLFLFAAAYMIYRLVRRVSPDFMHGYEMVYQHERGKKQENRSIIDYLKSPIDGLLLIIKKPFVMGIFSLTLFYEIMIVIFDYWVNIAADHASINVGSMTAYWAAYTFLYNTVGLMVSIFGTTPLLRILGVRISLLTFPIFSVAMLLIGFFFPTAGVLFWVLVFLRACNYALNHPVREILYIPTTKDIKFKAKTWIDAFGSRIAKGCGSIINISFKGAAPSAALASSLSICLSFSTIWIIVVYFLGKTLQDAISNKKIIGEEKPQETTPISQPNNITV